MVFLKIKKEVVKLEDVVVKTINNNKRDVKLTSEIFVRDIYDGVPPNEDRFVEMKIYSKLCLVNPKTGFIYDILTKLEIGRILYSGYIYINSKHNNISCMNDINNDNDNMNTEITSISENKQPIRLKIHFKKNKSTPDTE